MANSVTNFNNARRRKNERRRAERQRAEWQSTQRQRTERPIVQNQRVERPQRETTQTNSFGGSFVQRAAQNPLTPTQKIEQERSQRMRQGISLASRVVRSQVGRRFASNTRINKGLYQNLRSNVLEPVKNGNFKTGGHGIGEQSSFSKLRSFKQPASEVAKYTRKQQNKYVYTPNNDYRFDANGNMLTKKDPISIEYGKKLRAGMPSTNTAIMSWRSDPTQKEREYRDRYGYTKKMEEALDRRLNENMLEASYSPTTGEIRESENGRAFSAGHTDAWARENVEDTVNRQFGIKPDDDTLAKIEAQRNSFNYGAGTAVGQMEQYALTRGLLGTAGLVGNGTKAAKGVKGALKAMGVEAGIDQLASVPMNIVDALKADSTGDMVDRFVRNQKYDLVFSGVMEFIPFFKNKSVREDIQKAFNLHTAAKKETNEATKEILEKKVGDILDATKEDIQKEVNAITNANNVSNNALSFNEEQLQRLANSYESMTDYELKAEKTKWANAKRLDADEFSRQYDERINLIDDILDSRKKSEPIAEEPKQLYNEPRGDVNGTEKHQGEAERTGSGESEVRADVGAVQNGERQTVGGTHMENAPDSASTGRTGRTLSLTEKQRAVMDAAGKTNANLREADYSAFSNALNEGKASNKYGGYVDPQDVDKLTKKGAKTFLSDDGSVGFAITKDGDMIGAFNRGGKYRGAVDDMLITARLNGGTKLDCYGAGLVNKYEQAGYVPVAKIPFSAEYVNDPLLLKNKPDVYVMMKNSDDIDTVIRKNANGEYKLSTQEELDALRTFDDYDEALKYRDDLLKNGGTLKSEEPKAKAKAESEDTRTWQEKSREDYKTGKQRAKVVEEGKIPSRENGEVVNAIKRLKETKEFADIKDALDRGVKDGLYNRKYRHLDEEIDKAIKEIEEDPEKVINEILEYHPNGAKANDVPADAIPWVMKGYALCKWAEQNGMVALKEDIAATMAKAQSAGGSILRAGQVFTVMADPKTQRDIVADFVEKMQEKYAKRLGDHKLTVSEDLLNKLDEATTDAEKSKILDDITVHVWNQVPQNFIDAMGSLRIVSMLANTTTMIRNIASNVAFAGVREVDKGLNTAMEAAAEKLGKIDKEHRTHSVYNHFSKENRKIQAFWYNDYGKNRNIIKGQSRWDEGGGALNVDLRPQDARHFGVKAGGGRKGGLVGVASAGLEGTRKATSWIMDTGDEMFLAPAYADAATQLMHVRGWGIDDLTPARMQEIRDYATEVAQKATYRDPSDMAMALAKWGHWQKGDGALRAARAVIVSGLQPFKKTPINIGKRSIEYSPVGFVKGVYDIRKAVQAGDSAAANKAITELSKGTTGTGLVVAGYLLSEQGIINAQLPTDDEGYLRRDLGEQDYALNLGGKSRSLQWAAPGAIPILAGATLHDQVRQRGWNSLKNPAILVSVLAKSTNPILEMSFMQSYMDLIEATDDVKKGDKFWVGLEQIALSYASQFVPTILGKFANTIDPVRRDTSSQAENPYEKALQKAINKNLINKIPKWSESLPAYEDAFGNIQTTENMKDRIIQNFVSPWYTKEIKSDDPAYKELFRINDAIPDTNLIPTNAIGKGKHELSLNGEKINLDPHDMEEYKRIRGEGNQKALEFIDSDKYKSMSDTERSKALEDIYNNAKTEAKQQMLLKKGKSEWDVYTEGFSGGKAEQIDAAKNAGINAKDYAFTLTDKTADADGNGTYSKPEYYDYLLKQSKYNDKQKAVLMAAKNKSWEGKYNPFITGEPPEGSKETAASNANYTDAIKSTGLSEEQFNQVFTADKSKIDANGSGRVSQAEYQAYLDSFDFLTNEQKSAIWKQYNSHWKKNPYDGSSTASSGGRRRSRSGRRYSSGGGSGKVKARAKTESEKRFANLQKMQAPKTGKGIEALSGSAKGLTKAQKKAMLKLMQKKLEV